MKKSTLLLILAIVAFLGLARIYWLHSEVSKSESRAVQQAIASGKFSKAYAIGPMAGVIVHDERRVPGTLIFKDAKGKNIDLSAWKGRVVVLNLWATWCAPCRKEMPDLAELQKELGGPEFEVVALSVDVNGAEASSAFLRSVGAESLAVYTDTELKSLAAFQAIGLPATLLIDRNGLEAARLLGPADWSSPEALTMVKALLAEKP